MCTAGQAAEPQTVGRLNSLIDVLIDETYLFIERSGSSSLRNLTGIGLCKKVRIKIPRTLAASKVEERRPFPAVVSMLAWEGILGMLFRQIYSQSCRHYSNAGRPTMR
jgi:hypothetical protein